MNSGTFHVMSQEWRYFSREKSIIHTLHLGELPATRDAETVLIDSTPPPSHNNGGSFNVPPLNLPMSTQGGNTVENITFNTNLLSTCFASVGINKQVLAVKNAILQFSRWDAQEMRFLITPQQAGLFFMYIEAQSDERDPSVNYFGPIDPASSPATQAQRVNAVIRKVGQLALVNAFSAIYQSGPMDGSVVPLHWGPSLYIKTTHVARGHGVFYIDKGQAVEWVGNLLGNAPDAYVSGYMFKVADL